MAGGSFCTPTRVPKVVKCSTKLHLLSAAGGKESPPPTRLQGGLGLLQGKIPDPFPLQLPWVGSGVLWEGIQALSRCSPSRRVVRKGVWALCPCSSSSPIVHWCLARAATGRQNPERFPLKHPPPPPPGSSALQAQGSCRGRDHSSPPPPYPSLHTLTRLWLTEGQRKDMGLGSEAVSDLGH